MAPRGGLAQIELNRRVELDDRIELIRRVELIRRIELNHGARKLEQNQSNR